MGAIRLGVRDSTKLAYPAEIQRTTQRLYRRSQIRTGHDIVSSKTAALDEKEEVAHDNFSRESSPCCRRYDAAQSGPILC